MMMMMMRISAVWIFEISNRIE